MINFEVFNGKIFSKIVGIVNNKKTAQLFSSVGSLNKENSLKTKFFNEQENS